MVVMRLILLVFVRLVARAERLAQQRMGADMGIFQGSVAGRVANFSRNRELFTQPRD